MKNMIMALAIGSAMMVAGFLLTPGMSFAGQDSVKELEARVEKLEAQIETMAEDMANWKMFLANFQKGAQQNSDSHDVSLGPAGNRPTRGAVIAAGVGYAAGKALDWALTDGAEKLGTMVGNLEAGKPVTLKEPAPSNQSTSGQQGKPGQR